MNKVNRPLTASMGDSRVLVVNGVFLGAAVALPNHQGWRLVAANDRFGPLDGQVAATWSEAQRLARQAFLASSAA